MSGFCIDWNFSISEAWISGEKEYLVEEINTPVPSPRLSDPPYLHMRTDRGE